MILPDLPAGQRLGIGVLKTLAAINTSYDNLTPEEKRAMVQALEAEWAEKSKSVQSTNTSAGHDFRATSDHVGKEVCKLLCHDETCCLLGFD